MQSRWVWLGRGKIGRARRVDGVGRVGDGKYKGTQKAMVFSILIWWQFSRCLAHISDHRLIHSRDFS